MIHDRPSDAIMTEARELLKWALSAPPQFDLMLMRACDADSVSFDAANVIAHVALMLSDAPEFQSSALWLRGRATALLCRAYDAVALEREARAAAEAGHVH